MKCPYCGEAENISDLGPKQRLFKRFKCFNCYRLFEKSEVPDESKNPKQKGKTMKKKQPPKRLAARKKKEASPRIDGRTKAGVNAEMAENAKVIQGEAKGVDFEIIPKEKEIVIASETPIGDIIREKINFTGDGGIEIVEVITPEECVTAITWFSRAEKNASRMVGTLILYAEMAYGEKYEAIMLATGLAYQTLANIASTVKNVSPEAWHEKLTFAHHIQVAKLPAAKQNRLLNRAEKEGLSVAELKKEVAVEAPPKPKPKKKDTPPDDKPKDWEMSAEQIERDEKLLEKADDVLRYVKSKAFADLNTKACDQWEQLLRQFSDAYEKLIAS